MRLHLRGLVKLLPAALGGSSTAVHQVTRRTDTRRTDTRRTERVRPSPTTADAAPSALSVEPETARAEIRRALSHGASALLALPLERFAHATSVQRVRILRTLVRSSGSFFDNAGLRTCPRVPMTEAEKRLTRAIFDSVSHDAGAFDELFTRLSPVRLRSRLGAKEFERILSIKDGFDARVVPGDWGAFFRYLQEVTRTKPSGPSCVEPATGRRIYERLLSDIRNAEGSICAMTYQWADDEVGRGIVEELRRAADRGVQVRLILEEFGMAPGIRTAMRELAAHPNVRILTTPSSALPAHVNHRKLWVIDGVKGHQGGANVGNGYRDSYIDQLSAVTGAAVAALGKVFNLQWLRHPQRDPDAHDLPPEMDPETLVARNPPVDEGHRVFVVPHHGRGEDRNSKAIYLRAIATAEKTIDVASPFLTDSEVVQALCARARGSPGRPPLRVRVLVPSFEALRGHDLPAHLAAYWTAPAVRQLLEAGCEVYASHAFSHLKLLVADSKVVIEGCTNLDNRSLVLNDELDCVFETPDTSAWTALAPFEDPVRATRLTLETIGFPEPAVDRLLRTFEGFV